MTRTHGSCGARPVVLRRRPRRHRRNAPLDASPRRGDHGRSTRRRERHLSHGFRQWCCGSGTASQGALRLRLDDARHAGTRHRRHSGGGGVRPQMGEMRCGDGQCVGSADRREFPRHGAFSLRPHRHPRLGARYRGTALRCRGQAATSMRSGRPTASSSSHRRRSPRPAGSWPTTCIASARLSSCSSTRAA